MGQVVKEFFSFLFCIFFSAFLYNIFGFGDGQEMGIPEKE